MNKLYTFLLLLGVVATPALRAQTAPACPSPGDDLSAVILALDGQIFEGGEALDFCGTSGATGNLTFAYAESSSDAVATATGFESDGNGGFISQRLAAGIPYSLVNSTLYAFDFGFGMPIGDQEVTLTYQSGGFAGVSQATITIVGQGLPVELTSFQGRSTQKTIDLNWATAAESGNSGFEVQRSIQGANWVALGFVPTVADGNVAGDYSFQDTEPINGSSLYRLKQIDYDGRYEYSETVEVGFISENLLQVFPNPAGDELNLRIATGEQNYRALVTDQAGRTVVERTISGTDALDLTGFRRGMYQVSIITADGVVSQRFMKN